MIPVVYIHTGTIPDYLRRSLKQSLVYNKEVILLTDASITDLSGIKIENIKKYEQGLEKFEEVYQHMSTNEEDFERICIRRWFYLRNFMKIKNIQVCYYTDSDVMIYDDLTSVFNEYKEYEACYTLPEMQDNFRYSASACCSFWKLDSINKFCDFIVDTYTGEGKKLLLEKWNWHRQNNRAGGVCDMTLLYLFSKQINFLSLSKVKNGKCFDQNMLDPDNYHRNEYELQAANGRKRKMIRWKNGQPYAINKVLNSEIRFYVLTEYAKLLGMEKNLLGKVKQKVKSLFRN